MQTKISTPRNKIKMVSRKPAKRLLFTNCYFKQSLYIPSELTISHIKFLEITMLEQRNVTRERTTRTQTTSESMLLEKSKKRAL